MTLTALVLIARLTSEQCRCHLIPVVAGPWYVQGRQFLSRYGCLILEALLDVTTGYAFCEPAPNQPLLTRRCRPEYGPLRPEPDLTGPKAILKSYLRCYRRLDVRLCSVCTT
jgi:hypothetical protein